MIGNNPGYRVTQANNDSHIGIIGFQSNRRILIPGDPPDPSDLPKGCRFVSRCPVAEDACRTIAPDLRDRGAGHRVACRLVGDDAVSPLAKKAPAG